MTALEEIKKALKKVYIAEWYISGVKTNGLSVVHNAADSSMFGITAETFEAEYIAAVNPEAISELLSTLESLPHENEALRQDRYDLAYAITGGEDAPGLLDSTPTSEIVEIARHAHRSHSADIDRAEAAEAEVARLNAILEPFRAVSKDWVDENGWTDVACQKDRIVDWFGPSDFRALASTGGEHHAE